VTSIALVASQFDLATCLVNARCRGRSKFERCGGRVVEIRDLLKLLNKKHGETMTAETMQNAGYSIPERSQEMQDLLLVSSFGLWAVLPGLAPVLAFRLLMGS
jgi:hypothetical protein